MNEFLVEVFQHKFELQYPINPLNDIILNKKATTWNKHISILPSFYPSFEYLIQPLLASNQFHHLTDRYV
jgi:hypothetical protein